jgi:predicted transport protein
MALFKINNQKVIKISTIEANKERDIQRLFEKNLDTILNVDFLGTEYSTSFGGRIDTIGIDKTGSPVIIEYKKIQSENVINQGLSYLKWLLDHKADFEMLCKSKGVTLTIDWTTPRIICVAETYNKFDLDTVELLPIKIELIKYKLYENDLLFIDLESQKQVKISASKIFSKNKVEKDIVNKLQKDYSIDQHLQIVTKEIKELYLALKEKIISLDNSIVEEAKAKYIAYKLTTNFVDVTLQKNALKLFLNLPSGKLDDPHKIARDLTSPKKVGHWGNGDYEVVIKDQKDLDKLFNLIKQAYQYNK